MAKMPRTLWEILILVLLAAIGYGFWTWSDYRWQGRLAESEQRLLADVKAEREAAAEVLRQQGAREAEVAARVFAAGIRDEVLEARHEAIDEAVGALLRLPAVVFVHVLERDGGVIATSDRKLVATGRAGPSAAWALAATDTVTRVGATPQTTEVAVPLDEAEGVTAVLWLAYDVGATDRATAVPGVAAPETESFDDDALDEESAAADETSESTEL